MDIMVYPFNFRLPISAIKVFVFVFPPVHAFLIVARFMIR